jgi:hypothetical protein
MSKAQLDTAINTLEAEMISLVNKKQGTEAMGTTKEVDIPVLYKTKANEVAALLAYYPGTG